MRLSIEELEALVGLLDYYVPDLHAEIGRTSDRVLRGELRAEEAMLLGLRDKLVAARRDASENEASEELGL